MFIPPPSTIIVQFLPLINPICNDFDVPDHGHQFAISLDLAHVRQGNGDEVKETEVVTAIGNVDAASEKGLEEK